MPDGLYHDGHERITGKEMKLSDIYSFGDPILCVADGTVIRVEDSTADAAADCQPVALPVPGPQAQPQATLNSPINISFSARRSTFPVSPIGSASTNTIRSGTL
jgi:hypothetical protein